MPDISKCANNLCPLRLKCYRYRCVPTPIMQTYADFKPTKTKNKTECDAFWSIKGYDVKTLMPESFVPKNIWDENEFK